MTIGRRTHLRNDNSEKENRKYTICLKQHGVNNGLYTTCEVQLTKQWECRPHHKQNKLKASNALARQKKRTGAAILGTPTSQLTTDPKYKPDEQLYILAGDNRAYNWCGMLCILYSMCIMFCILSNSAFRVSSSFLSAFCYSAYVISFDVWD